MIIAAAVCPHPPLLFRELTGQLDGVAELRAACALAVGSLVTAAPDVVVVVGGADATGRWDGDLAGDVRAFGAAGPRDLTGLPLSLGVGRRLLDEAGWNGSVELLAVRWDASRADLERVARDVTSRDERVGLLVLGDGSARRGAKAPGYLDARAFAFDDAIATALDSGDARALLELDADLAQALMVGGRAAFGVLGAVVDLEGSKVRASTCYRDDPYGVSYHVAVWDLSD